MMIFIMIFLPVFFSWKKLKRKEKAVPGEQCPPGPAQNGNIRQYCTVLRIRFRIPLLDPGSNPRD
jgi:hypothetical protein